MLGLWKQLDPKFFGWVYLPFLYILTNEEKKKTSSNSSEVQLIRNKNCYTILDQAFSFQQTR